MDLMYEVVIVSELLKNEVSEKEYVYVGVGAEFRLDTTKKKLLYALTSLKEKGYKTHYVRVGQAVVKVLTQADKTYKDVWANKDRII